jgi:hypothetical protein
VGGVDAVANKSLANAGRHHSNPDLIVAQIVQLELFNRE